MAAVAWVNSTNELELTDFSRNGVLTDSARITLMIRDAATGVDIAGPTMMRPVAGTVGDYTGGFSSEVPLIAGGRYFAIIDATVETDVGRWEFPFTAQTRKK